MTNFVVNDGGRAESGYKGHTGDCVTRALAIAMQLPYQYVYAEMANGNATQRASKRTKGNRPRSARNGICTTRKWFKDFMTRHGWVWCPTMGIGTGCRVHLTASELPAGRLVVAVSKHYTAVVDGVIHDTANPDRNGTRCVYGYWHKI